MDIVCPNCATLFSVPDGAIGPKGRKMKCSKCGHLWREMPPEATPAPAPSFAPAPAPAPAPAYREPPRPAPLPLEAEPLGRSGGSRPAASSPLDDDDDLLGGMDFGSGGDSNDALEEEFKSYSLESDDDSFDPLSSDFDDLLKDDDPIPNMYSPGMAGEGPSRKSGGGFFKKLVGIIVLLALLMGVVGAGAFIARDRIVRALPAAERVYDLLGVEITSLGIGLRFRNVTSERLARDGTDTLVVRGFIANISDKDRTVPFLRLALFDATEAVVQSLVAEPPERALAAGETIGFRIQLENPSAAARRFEVDWTAPPQTGGQGAGAMPQN